MTNNKVWQYEQPRCPDGWNESERRFYTRLIEIFDDIYAKYGRIDEKMLSKKVVERIDNSAVGVFEKITADIVSSGKIAADTVEATFAYLVSLTARYGSFDFAAVENFVSSAMVLEKGVTDELYIKNLMVSYAQMVNATVEDLRIKAADGNYYKLTVTTDGSVSAEKVEVSNPEISAGITNDGGYILETTISAESLNASDIMSVHALINKIDAASINVDELTARVAFLEAIKTAKIFADGGSLQMLAEDVKETVDGVANVSSRLEQTADAFQLELNKKVGEDTLKQYLRYEDGTVEMGSSDSRYKLQASNTGVVILQDGSPMTRMEQNTVAAPVFEAGRMLKIGEHTIKTSASGALIFN